jgi:hypothetical protein
MVARVKFARSPLLPPRIMSRQTVHRSSLVVALTERGPSGPQCLQWPLPCTPVTRERSEDFARSSSEGRCTGFLDLEARAVGLSLFHVFNSPGFSGCLLAVLTSMRQTRSTNSPVNQYTGTVTPRNPSM